MAYAEKVKETNDFKPFPRGLKDGVNRQRVLPGIHSAAATGDWAKKYQTHTVGIPRDEDPEKFDWVTFHCVEVVDWVNREKVVLETCPECVRIADQKAKYEKLKVQLMEELKSGVKSRDEVKKLLRPYVNWLKHHSRSFWWAVNVVDPDGKYFTQKWPNDVKKLFDARKKKLKDEDNVGAILPINEGVWLDITRIPGEESGTGFPKYEMDVAMENLGGGTKRIKLAPLAPESADDAEKTCWDINDPGIITLTRDQVKQVATSGDSPAALRGIFKQSTRVEKKTEKVEAKDIAVSDYSGSGAKAETSAKPKDESLTPGHDVPAMETKKLAPPPAAAETDDDRMVREAQEAVAAAQARREANRKAVITPSAPPKVEEKKPDPKPEVKPEAKKVEEKKPDPKPPVDDVDAEMAKFEKEFDLKGAE